MALTPSTTVTTCTAVRDGAPALDVFRDEDGSYSVLCGADHATGEETPVSLHFSHLHEADPTLAKVPVLMPGASAHRAHAKDAWRLSSPHEHGIDAERQREARLVANVEKFGFHILSVTGGDDSDEPGFSYTVGLYETCSHPELITFGSAGPFSLFTFPRDRR